MASFVKFQDFNLQLGKGLHNFSSHTLKLALTNTAPNAATHAVLADITQIAATGGYVSGGFTVDSVTWSLSGGVASLANADEIITASGGTMGPMRWVVLYNATAAGGPLIGYWDYASSFSLNSGESFTVDFGATTISLA